jgi:glycerol-3-phosphate dehydrogenase
VLGAKGVHLLVPAARVGNRGALTLAAPQDGRVVFVLPAGGTAAAQFTLVGTTETPASRGPDEARARPPTSPTCWPPSTTTSPTPG